MFLAFTACFSSCVSTYGIPNMQSTATYLHQPAHADTTSVVKEATYVSGNLAFTPGPGAYESGESSVFGGLAINKSIVHNSYGFNYGAFGYLGKYEVSEFKNGAGNKNYFGGGITGGSYLRLGKRRKFLDLGVRASVMHEGGEYRAYRRDFRLINDFIDQHPHSLTTHLIGQMVFNFKLADLKAGVYSSFGGIFGQSDPSSTFNLGFFTTNKRYSFNCEIIANGLEYGLMSFGLAYRLSK